VHPGGGQVGAEGEWEPDAVEGEEHAGVVYDVGVGRSVDGTARTPGSRGAGLSGQGLGADEAVAVAHRPPVGEVDGVHHAVAAEPVVAVRVGRGRGRVRADPQQPAVEPGGQRSLHGQLVVVGAFLAHRGEGALEIGVAHVVS
jgi:hypothetical protein